MNKAFRSRNKWGAKIDGQNTAEAGFDFAGANYVRIQGFEIYKVANSGGSASGVEVLNGGRFSEIVGNRIHEIGRVCTDTSNGERWYVMRASNARSGLVRLDRPRAGSRLGSSVR